MTTTRDHRTVLVTAASKHGATAEIATIVGDALTERGIRVSVRAPEQVGSVDGYRACVIGSAVYGGRWMKEATELVLHNVRALRGRPVWLFSSGAVGDPPHPRQDPADAATLVEIVQPREHRAFSGKLDRASLGLFERWSVQSAKATYGDYRDWDAIRAWAATIAEVLRREPEHPRVPDHREVPAA